MEQFYFLFLKVGSPIQLSDPTIGINLDRGTWRLPSMISLKSRWLCCLSYRPRWPPRRFRSFSFRCRLASTMAYHIRICQLRSPPHFWASRSTTRFRPGSFRVIIYEFIFSTSTIEPLWPTRSLVWVLLRFMDNRRLLIQLVRVVTHLAKIFD